MAVKIQASVLKQQVEEGKKLKDLCEIYSLPQSQMKRALQQLGLKIRKFHLPKFEIVDDEGEDDVVRAVVEDTTDNLSDTIEDYSEDLGDAYPNSVNPNTDIIEGDRETLNW